MKDSKRRRNKIAQRIKESGLQSSLDHKQNRLNRNNGQLSKRKKQKKSRGLIQRRLRNNRVGRSATSKNRDKIRNMSFKKLNRSKKFSKDLHRNVNNKYAKKNDNSRFW